VSAEFARRKEALEVVRRVVRAIGKLNGTTAERMVEIEELFEAAAWGGRTRGLHGESKLLSGHPLLLWSDAHAQCG